MAREGGESMNGLVFHIASGQSFFSGIVLVTLAAIASTCSSSILRRTTAISFPVGVIAIAVSSTAIPHWCYGATIAATVAWIASCWIKAWRVWSSRAVVAVWSMAGLIEAPYHRIPSLAPAPDRTLTVIGDSVTAGVGDENAGERWPSILAREHQLQVKDISQMGDTAALALKRVKLTEIDASIVIVEIGGNDVLGLTTSDAFRRDLDALLSHLEGPGRQIIMFELPLPPFHHAYGRAQRETAAKHHLLLVPRRVFLSILAANGSTLDSIHLTPAGHRAMAASVWSLVESAYAQ